MVATTPDGSGYTGATYAKVPVVERNLAGGRLLVQRLGAGQPTQLSGSAPLIWDLLDTYFTVAELVARLTERFSDPEGTIEGGVRAALASLESQGLVTQS